MRKAFRLLPFAGSAALGFALALALVPPGGCASRSREPAPVPPQRWQWPAGQGNPPDLESDRAKCQYEAAEFKVKYPDLYRITVNKCLEQRGWVRDEATADAAGDR